MKEKEQPKYKRFNWDGGIVNIPINAYYIYITYHPHNSNYCRLYVLEKPTAGNIDPIVLPSILYQPIKDWVNSLAIQ